MSRKKDDSNQQPEWFSWIWILVFVFGSGAVASYLIPIAILGAIGYGIYRHQSQKKVRIEAKQASIGRIEDLKSEIGQADRRIKKLEAYQEDGDQESYQNLALEILPQRPISKMLLTTYAEKFLPQSTSESRQKFVLSPMKLMNN